MVRPLKKCTEDGVPYSRPPAIERSIAQALAAAPATLLARAAISDRRNAEYLAPEVLVHLIRHALRMQDYSTANALLGCLGKRCAQMLKRRVRETTAFRASDVREETVSRLYELFAEDTKNPDDVPLDYYEVHFNKAFVTVRAGIIRKAFAHQAPLESLSDSSDEGEDVEPVELQDLSPAADVVLCAENEQLARLIQALPRDEREAIVWKYFFNLKTESTDQTERTVASLCEVSGSEIRSRLRAAYARLKKRIEETS